MLSLKNKPSSLKKSRFISEKTLNISNFLSQIHTQLYHFFINLFSVLIKNQYYIKLVILGLFLTFYSIYIQPIYINSLKTVKATTCPEGYTDQQCLDYLNQQKKDLANQKAQIKKRIANENKIQDTLLQQINEIKNDIEDTQLTIKDKQLQISIANLEIQQLSIEMSKTQNIIDTMIQETNKSENKIKNSILNSYQSSLKPPWYVLLQGKGLGSLIETIQYQVIIRKEDEKSLVNLKNQRLELDRQKAVLDQQKQDIVTRRNLIESENIALNNLQSELAVKQKKQVELLLASQKREAELAKLKRQFESQENAVARDMASYALKLLKKGQLGKGTPVKKGSIIGFQGHTGCSLGSHIHFGIAKDSTSANVNPFKSNYFSGSTSYHSMVYSKNAQVPLDGAMLTQGFHSGMSIDMISTTAGIQDGSTYYAKKGSITCSIAKNYEGNLSLRGEGAPIYAILDGTIYKSLTDQYGGKYTVIDHGDGLASMYWHLR